MNVEEPALALHPQSSASRRESRDDCFSEDLEGEDRTSLVDGVAYLSLCASGTTDTTSEPYYVGSSSGATIARIIQSSIFRSSGKRATTLPVNQACQATGTYGLLFLPSLLTPMSPLRISQTDNRHACCLTYSSNVSTRAGHCWIV